MDADSSKSQQEIEEAMYFVENYTESNITQIPV